MTQAQFNLMVRVIFQRRLNGETIEEILNSYPKLTKEERSNIQTEVTTLLQIRSENNGND